MFSEKAVSRVVAAIEASPGGIASLELLESLRLCGRDSLITALSRLGKAGRVVRLKRGVYSASPMRDAFACAQATYNGYLAFSSALCLHGMITEMPFTITVATASTSESKRFGQFEFRAVALGKRAVGFERKGAYVVSTRAKTLFDCLYLPRYSVEKEKLEAAWRALSAKERSEFAGYAKELAPNRGDIHDFAKH
ncbi:MAG: hypothetical protein NTX79_02555 [Candidatus Micrarchaeota archaeon]|nr:hypothetical protein [Candidatus Micrarchaeota archaeon]